MFSSLYVTVKSLAAHETSGTLMVSHKYGENGELVFKDGRIVDCKIGELTGADAAGKLAKWISFNVKFSKGSVNGNNGAGLDTQTFITHLGKIKTWVEKIQQVVPHNSARFKIRLNGSKKQFRLKPSRLEIALALDGKKTITQLVSDFETSEFEVLNTIYYLNQLGMAEMVGAHETMEDAERESFLNSLKETLSRLVSLAAEFIIEDAFESIKSKKEFLTRHEIPDLIDAIAAQLDLNERQVFLEWWRKQSQWQ